MKIFDCFMYFDEQTVLDLRLNILDKYVDYFVIVESRFNHKGEVDTVVEMPVPNITSCTFGGKDLKTLFVTTAKMGMTDEEKVKYPEAGNLFAINTNYQGKPDFKFAN